jgi:hypothetical protein
MEITVTLDQAETIKQTLRERITRLELDNKSATQERETIARVGMAMLLEEINRYKAAN